MRSILLGNALLLREYYMQIPWQSKSRIQSHRFQNIFEYHSQFLVFEEIREVLIPLIDGWVGL